MNIENRKNLCFVVTDLEIGGSTALVANILRHLDYSIFNVSLVCFFNRITDKYAWITTSNHVKCFFLNKKRTIDIPFNIRLKKTLKKINPDIISSHLTSTFYLRNYFNSAKTKVFHTIHSNPELDLPKIYRIFLRKKIQRGEIKLIACSESIKELAQKLYKVDIFLASNGVEVQNRQIKEFPKGYFIFLFVGRFDKVKNVSDLIRAFSLASKTSGKIKLVLCGDGPLKQEYKDLINELSLQDKINILSPSSDVNKLYSSSSCFCLVSSREGGPISVLEAMSFGLPIVGTDIPGIRNYVTTGENGLLSSVHEIKDLTSSLIDISKDEEKYSYLSKENLEKVKKYTIEATVKEYENIFLNN